MAFRVLVGCKRVIDYAAKVRVKPDKSGVVVEGVKHSMNPFDEIAIEEAVRLKEQKIASEIIAFSCGAQSSKEILRTALAMGADRGILVDTDQPVGPLEVAKMMVNLIKTEKIDLVLLGKQSIDGDNAQVPALLASILNWPHALYVSKIEKDGDHLRVKREVDGGHEVLSFKTPAVLSCDLRLNTPRYATLPNIMKAKKKVISEMKPDDLNVKIPQASSASYTEPPNREGGTRVANVDELLSKLKEAGLV